MSDFRTIDLRGKLSKRGRLEFLSATVSAFATTPFAIVYIAKDGVAQPLGFRLDMDKGAFLDLIGDPDSDKDLASRARAVAEAIDDASHVEPVSLK
jgi:hypothetical protein